MYASPASKVERTSVFLRPRATVDAFKWYDTVRLPRYALPMGELKKVGTIVPSCLADIVVKWCMLLHTDCRFPTCALECHAKASTEDDCVLELVRVIVERHQSKTSSTRRRSLRAIATRMRRSFLRLALVFGNISPPMTFETYHSLTCSSSA